MKLIDNEKFKQINDFSGLNYSGPLKKGAVHVQAKTEEVAARFIRLLSTRVRGSALADIEKFEKAVGALSNTFSHHALFFLRPLLIHLDLVYERPGDSTQSPLWTRLLHKNLSLRKVSAEYSSSADNLFKAFGIKSIAQILSLNKTDFRFAYNMGQLELAESLVEKNETKDEKTYCEKISVMKGLPVDWTALNLSSKALLLAQETQQNKTISSDLVNAIENETKKVLSMPFESDCNRMTVTHVLNSLNLFYFKAGDLCKVNDNLVTVEKIAEKIENADAKNHIIGNFYFHRSQMETADAQEMSLLLKAEAHDSGYFDYFYRIAVLLHDRGDVSAKNFYESSLAVSPFNFSLVNDYGCFLKDFGFQDEFGDWCQLIEGIALFPCESKDEDEPS